MNKREKLISLYKKMKKDETLPLKGGANRLVFGSGNVNASIMLIGEGPGYWEDQKGVPFVGRAGAFLDQLLSAANLNREDVFITNVVHHRPPQNRDPLPEELAAYSKYLDNIITIIKPRKIVTLGRFSMGKFLPDVKISNVHGVAKKVNFKDLDIVVIPMYHPAAGLRSTDIKEKTIQDFKKFADILSNKDQKKQKESLSETNQEKLI